jgi:hypothetical protein
LSNSRMLLYNILPKVIKVQLFRMGTLLLKRLV